MTTGSSDMRPFSRLFQMRWAERLGDPANPYLTRWTLIFLGYSLRLHHWMRSDDRRFFHDHSAGLLSIVLKGRYANVKPRDPDKPPSSSNNVYCHVQGMFNSWRNLLSCSDSIWYSKATDRHYLAIPKKGAWTLLLEGRKTNKWGFYVPRKDRRGRYVGPVRKMRPVNYFRAYGIAQADPDYQ